jgi:hypothetical protein
MSRTPLLLAGAASAALVLAGGVAFAQTRAADDDVARTVAEAQADAAQARVQADHARAEAGEIRERVLRQVRERGVRVERDGDVTIIRTGRDGADHAQHLRNLLQLRPNQEAALTAYLAAMKPKDVAVRMEKMDDGAKTTPERLARMEQRLNERQAEQRARIDAIRRFYGQLDAAQKKAFDELPPMGMGSEVRIIRTSGHGMDHMRMPPLPPIPPVPPVPPAPPSL